MVDSLSKAGRAAPVLAICIALLSASQLSAQQLKTLTETAVGPDRIALGYPVPVAQDTPLPFDGFRSYLGLHTRAQDLRLVSPRLHGEVVGQTLEGREIWAYRVGDADLIGAEGRPEPALMINGGIHAREWQSPEVVMGLLESLVESSDPAGLDRYLLEEVNLVLIPVLNIDGFLMTQAEPARIWEGQDPGNPAWPRDGRMRRKNHRNTDGVFSTAADHRGGVDLNRNNNPYWASSTQSSSNPNSLIFHGIGAASEPEIQALLAASRLAPEPQLRAYVDAHSFTQVLFTIRTTNSRRNAIMRALAVDFSSHHRAISSTPERPFGRVYTDLPDTPGSGIGQTAEYFANVWQIPAWTLEIEPGDTGAVEYGGFGYHHDGFILPESQIRRVREQLADSHRVLLYHSAGPAIAAALELRQPADGALLQRSVWRANSPQLRQLQVDQAQALEPGGRYRLLLRFDRPMRDRRDGVSQVYPGQNEAGLLPKLSLTSAAGTTIELPADQGRWLGGPDASGNSFARYREDSYLLDFDLPADFPAGPARLEIDTVDLIGRRLDAYPVTPVDWANGHWVGYDSDSTGSSEGDFGGVDRSFTVVVGAGPRIALVERPLQLMEGGSVSLRFERQGDLAGPASLSLAFTPTAGLLASAVQLDWGDGEGGVQQVQLSARDDLLVAADRELRVVLDSQLALPVTELRLALLDNDTPALRRAVIGEVVDETDPAARAARLGELLLAAAAVGVPVELQLASGEFRFPAAAAGADLVDGLGALTGELHIIGAQTRVDLGGRRFAAVAAGSTLGLTGLHLVNGGSSPASGAVFDNQGSLNFSDCQLRAMSGVLMANQGTLTVERCGLLDLGADALQHSSGSALLTNVTLADMASRIEGPIWRQSGGQALWQHVSLRAAGPVAAVTVNGGGLLELEDSLLSLAQPAAAQTDACVGYYASLGGNVLGGPGCVAAVGNDLRLAEAVIEAIDPVTATAIPAAMVEAASRSCPQRDQLGAPRAASCLPGARSAEAAFARGLWWNPERPGHGQHITVVQNIAFMLWYTYDENGLPITWTAQGPLVDGRMFAPLLQWRRQEISDVPVSQQIGGVDLRVVDAATILLGWGLNSGAGSGFEVLQPFRFRTDQPMSRRSGLYADFDDLGWGLTLQEQGDTAFALLYYFGADDRLRWASAQGNGGIDQRLAALTQTGRCLYCADTARVAHPAGELRLAAVGPDELSFVGAMSATVAPGGSWLRQTLLRRFDGYK